MKKVFGTVAAVGLSLSLASSPAFADTTATTTSQTQTVRDKVVEARKAFKLAERNNLSTYKSDVAAAKKAFRDAVAVATDDVAKNAAVEARKSAMKAAKKKFLQANQSARIALKAAISAARN